MSVSGISYIVFYLSLLLIFYTYAGYPVLINLLGLLTKKKYKPDYEYTPDVSLIIPAHNESSVIRKKIENALSMDYPKEKFQIIVASDDSSDDTAAIAGSFPSDRIKVLDYKERAGKMGTIIKAIKEAEGEIIVLTDANAMFAPDTVRELVAPLADPAVGCVSGSKIITREDNNLQTTDKEEYKYWQYENFIKTGESLTGSCVGADGSVYAIKKSLFPDVPGNRLVMDDFIVSLKITLKGYRCVFTNGARAFESGSSDTGIEFRRKARILAGAVSVITIIPQILVSSISLKIISHKILRWKTPFFMLAIFVTSCILHNDSLISAALYAQIIFYSCAVLGYIFEKAGHPIPVFKQAFYFSLTAIAQVSGLFIFLRDRKVSHWENLRNNA